MLISEQNLAALFKGVKMAYNAGHSAAKPLWPQLATLVPSNTKEEQYSWLGQFPRLREWVGDRVIKNLKAYGYSIKNRKFESTISIPRDDIEDDTYGIFKPLFEEMGASAAAHPDELLFELILSGFATKCYDGRAFFDANHEVVASDGDVTPVSNVQLPANPADAKPAWFLLDTSRPLKPFIFQQRRPYNFVTLDKEADENVFMRQEYIYGVDGRMNVGFGFWQQAFGSKLELNAANFGAAYNAMTALKTEEGRSLGIKPNLLLIGNANREAAFFIAQADKLANGQPNPNYGLLDVVVTSHLD
ncbi:Mu-like prophage major head subunit gpT family protein [Cupriavidus sp. WS]|uniref:Mu-like prophage major head subunit gpT family protein n=1 Tax=Cupriavidus sp. WS TaxID=1312922 RepID=UPI0003A875A4|nr:Mu-like prophage major head subunit gpT family protein [Cupriavidus sp. WS]